MQVEARVQLPGGLRVPAVQGRDVERGVLVPAACLHPADVGHVAAVGGEGDGKLAAGPGRHLRHLASLGRDGVDLDRVPIQIGFLAAVGGEDNPFSVGRPVRFGLVVVAFGQLGRFTRGGVDRPDVELFFRQIAHAVELVVEVGDVAVGDAELLLLLVLFPLQLGRVFLPELADELRAVGRPFESGDRALERRHLARLAAVDGDNIDL